MNLFLSGVRLQDLADFDVDFNFSIGYGEPLFKCVNGGLVTEPFCNT